MRVVKRRNTVSLGVTPSQEPPPDSGVHARTIRAEPPPPSGGSRTPTLPQVYGSDDSAETALNDVVRQLALLADPLSVPVLVRPVGPADGVAPQEAYVASLLGAAMTVQEIVDVSPLSEDETIRFLARLVTAGIVSIAGVRKEKKKKT